MNKHSGFGGLCAEPYCDEFQFMVKRHLVDSDKDKSLAFNFTDPCQELARKYCRRWRRTTTLTRRKSCFGPLFGLIGPLVPGFGSAMREHSL